MDKFVTVFTDASHCPVTNSYGWAVWVKHGADGDTLRWWGGGYGKENAAEAEREALDKAISILLVSEVDLQDKIVVIRSDCQSVLDQFEIERLHKAGAKHVAKKHVKSHRGYSTKGSSVNTWCDRMARKQMRRYRKRLTGHRRISQGEEA